MKDYTLVCSAAIMVTIMILGTVALAEYTGGCIYSEPWVGAYAKL